MRNFLKKAEEIGETITIKGAHWDQEIGIMRFLARKGDLDCPAVVFDEIADYPAGYRVLCGAPNSCRRLAMILGLEHESNDPSSHLGLIGQIRGKLRNIKEMKYRSLCSCLCST